MTCCVCSQRKEKEVSHLKQAEGILASGLKSFHVGSNRRLTQVLIFSYLHIVGGLSELAGGIIFTSHILPTVMDMHLVLVLLVDWILMWVLFKMFLLQRPHLSRQHERQVSKKKKLFHTHKLLTRVFCVKHLEYILILK